MLCVPMHSIKEICTVFPFIIMCFTYRYLIRGETFFLRDSIDIESRSHTNTAGDANTYPHTTASDEHYMHTGNMTRWHFATRNGPMHLRSIKQSDFRMNEINATEPTIFL